MLRLRPWRAHPLIFATLVAALMCQAALPVAAHGGHAGFQQTKKLGDHVATLEAESSLVTAKSFVTWYVTTTRVDNGNLVTLDNLTLRFVSPTNESVEAPLETIPGGIQRTRALFAHQGAWRANLTDNATGASAEYTFEVYGESPFIVESMNADINGDVYVVDQPVEIELLATYISTGLPAPAPENATARIEHWTDDHQTKLAEKIVPLRTRGPGNVVLETTFEETGMYHVFVAAPAWDLEYEDRPYIHMYAVDRERAKEMGLIEDNEVPLSGHLALLALLAAAALVLRRRTT